MADISIRIGGRTHRLACRDGEENALLAAGKLADARMQELRQSHGDLPEPRLMLMAMLVLAGELLEERRGTKKGAAENAAPTPAAPSVAPAHLQPLLRHLAEAAESLAAMLEKEARSS